MNQIGIIGLGYVGLPLAVAFAEQGSTVIGVDVDPNKIASLRAGESYIEDISSERLRAAMADDKLCVTSKYAPLARCEAVIIAVPTPLTANREPELGPLRSSSEALAQVLQKGQLVVLESTTYPGTTTELLVPILQNHSDLRVPEDVNVAFSPERVDPGNEHYRLDNTPKVVGGISERCTERAVELYSRVCAEIIPVSSPDTAEMTKLLENIFRAVNIALVNEMEMLAQKMGIDMHEVIDAAATKPYGFMRFEPGPGLGGHCIPIDPFYLTWRAREFHMATEFIELAGKINQQKPVWCVEQIEAALNANLKAVNGSKVLLLGVSYKAGIGDMRESPALRIISELRRRGAVLYYHDEFVPTLPDEGLMHTDLEAGLADADIVVLVTAHPGVDYDRIKREADVFIDLRGITRAGLKVQQH
jgi:UDP-N-acetyl-D-glucosamine dehydrogenase